VIHAKSEINLYNLDARLIDKALGSYDLTTLAFPAFSSRYSLISIKSKVLIGCL
jgi:hypothetical protein